MVFPGVLRMARLRYGPAHFKMFEIGVTPSHRDECDKTKTRPIVTGPGLKQKFNKSKHLSKTKQVWSEGLAKTKQCMDLATVPQAVFMMPHAVSKLCVPEKIRPAPGVG